MYQSGPSPKFVNIHVSVGWEGFPHWLTPCSLLCHIEDQYLNLLWCSLTWHCAAALVGRSKKAENLIRPYPHWLTMFSIWKTQIWMLLWIELNLWTTLKRKWVKVKVNNSQQLNTIMIWYLTKPIQMDSRMPLSKPRLISNVFICVTVILKPDDFWLINATVTIAKTVVGDCSMIKINARVCNKLAISLNLKWLLWRWEPGLASSVFGGCC